MMVSPLMGDQDVDFADEVVGVGSPKENLHEIMPFDIVI